MMRSCWCSRPSTTTRPTTSATTANSWPCAAPRTNGDAAIQAGVAVSAGRRDQHRGDVRGVFDLAAPTGLCDRLLGRLRAGHPPFVLAECENRIRDTAVLAQLRPL